MHKPCPWCGAEEMHGYPNPQKGLRRRLATVAHLVIVLAFAVLLLHELYLAAGMALVGSAVLLYSMMCGPFFNDFRVCPQCARIEAAPRGLRRRRDAD
jgi:hypothetical protein